MTKLYPGQGPDSLATVASFQSLTTNVLWSTKIPLNFNSSTAGRIDPKYLGADLVNPFQPPAPLTLRGSKPIPYLGRHYFDGSGTPTFDLSEAKLRAGVGKTGEANVPANADKGPLKTGAVKWLQLSDTGLGLSKGVTVVYRVITAGGVAESCTTTNGGTGSVPYTAFYWFYG